MNGDDERWREFVKTFAPKSDEEMAPLYRAELRDRFAIEIVGSLILRMPADNVITPAMCKTVWTIADDMIKERGE